MLWALLLVRRFFLVGRASLSSCLQVMNILRALLLNIIVMSMTILALATQSGTLIEDWTKTSLA